MKITAKIETTPALKVSFEVTRLEPFESAHKLALSMQERLGAIELPFPKSLQRRLAKAFEKAFAALPETERLYFCQPSQAVTEAGKIGARMLEDVPKVKAKLYKQFGIAE